MFDTRTRLFCFANQKKCSRSRLKKAAPAVDSDQQKNRLRLRSRSKSGGSGSATLFPTHIKGNCLDLVKEACICRNMLDLYLEW